VSWKIAPLARIAWAKLRTTRRTADEQRTSADHQSAYGYYTGPRKGGRDQHVRPFEVETENDEKSNDKWCQRRHVTVSAHKGSCPLEFLESVPVVEASR
jgi:hypothetical protein